MTLSDSQRIARDLAAALGNGWHFDDPPDSFPTGFVQGPDGLQLTVRLDRDRVTIRGRLPDRDSAGQYVDHGVVAPSIGVNRNRAPDAMASEIRRRLFPAYEAAYEQAAVRVAERNRYLGQTIDAMSALETIEILDRHAQSTTRASLRTEGNFWGDVQVSGDSVNIEIHSLTVTQAKRVLRLLKQLYTEIE